MQKKTSKHMDTKAKLAELRTRTAAISDSVNKENESQKSIGPGSRDATTKTTGNNGNKDGGVEKQNSNQKAVRGSGSIDSSTDEYTSAGKMSPSSY